MFYLAKYGTFCHRGNISRETTFAMSNGFMHEIILISIGFCYLQRIAKSNETQINRIPPVIFAAMLLPWSTPWLDCFTIYLHNPYLRHLLCRRTVSGLWKTMEIPTSHVSPQCIASYPEFSASEETHSHTHSRWHHPVTGHVSYPTDGPTATSRVSVYCLADKPVRVQLHVLFDGNCSFVDHVDGLLLPFTCHMKCQTRTAELFCPYSAEFVFGNLRLYLHILLFLLTVKSLT